MATIQVLDPAPSHSIAATSMGGTKGARRVGAM
jgi:hypothetical protein